MKIVVIFGSHRLGGTNKDIEDMLNTFSEKHDFTYIHMATSRVEGCISCHKCGKAGNCILPPSEHDHFHEIFDELVKADVILIISPIYAIIPSRLTALFERLTSVLFDTGVMNTNRNPLLNKKVGIFSYCSNKICDEKELKIIFDKFLMKGYRFDISTYQYLNNCENPNEKYGGIVEYVKETVINL